MKDRAPRKKIRSLRVPTSPAEERGLAGGAGPLPRDGRGSADPLARGLTPRRGRGRLALVLAVGAGLGAAFLAYRYEFAAPPKGPSISAYSNPAPV